MNLKKKIIVCFLTAIMILGILPQTLNAEEATLPPFQNEVKEETSGDNSETIASSEESLPEEIVSDETNSIEESNNTVQEQPALEEPITTEDTNYNLQANNSVELDVSFELKGATYFDGSPMWGTTQNFVDFGGEVPYNGWQLMQVTLQIPHQDGLEVLNIQPSIESAYPNYSVVKKDDKSNNWLYTFFFYENGSYDFTINYNYNGSQQTTQVSYSVDGLVSIKDIAMRRHSINEYGEFSGLSFQDGQYVTKDILAMIPSVGFFTFGLDGDNGRTAENTTSLDGLQYLTNATGLYLFDCKKLATGETIEPVTQGYYPNMKRFRVSELNQRPQMPSHAYNAELVTQSIANMPALEELVINGTGFSDCSVFRKLTDGKLYYLQAMANNIVSLDGIESQPNLSSVNIGQNKIKSIEPLSKLNEINFLNLMRNQVFDLSPVNNNLNKEAVAGNTVKGFAAKEQKIEYEKIVLATLENDNYKIELPMPIDIDGTLTDTSSVTVNYSGSNSKVYNSFKENEKTFIQIPVSDVDTSLENPFENVIFSFEFNNNKGNDTRTKGWFTGTVTFKASPKVTGYKTIYSFYSGTRGKSLPLEVTELLPIDPYDYSEGDIVYAIAPAKTTVEVSDGVWTFKGYDADSKLANSDNADRNGNITFTGKWEFEKNVSIINRIPTIDASDKTLTVGDKFDPLKDVAARDEEDGDIILTIENVIKNEVDTTNVGVYEVVYKVTDSQGASSVRTIKVTVKAKDIPVTPDKPDDSNKPDDPNKPIVIPNTSVHDENPQIGDNTNMTLWSLLLIASSIGLIGTLAWRKYRQF